MNTTYLTADLFYDIIELELKSTYIDWPLFGMHGTVYPEAGKIKPFIQMYNSKTLSEINCTISGLHLPQEYYSVQIRGGDKITETNHLTGAAETVELIKQTSDFNKIQHIFVFTDDYANITELKELCPHWNIYTLCKESEHGYYNSDFNNGA